MTVVEILGWWLVGAAVLAVVACAVLSKHGVRARDRRDGERARQRALAAEALARHRLYSIPEPDKRVEIRRSA